MSAGRWNQGSQNPTEVVVHITRVPECGRRGAHDCTHELVCLAVTWILQVKPVTCNPTKRCIVQNNDTVRIIDEPLKSQNGIVWLYNDIGCLF